MWRAVRIPGAGALLIIALAMLLPAGTVSAETIRIVALGDSNFGAPGVAQSDAYPAQLERALKARGLDVTVVNEGRNGDTTIGVLNRLAFAVPDNTDLVLVSVGVNDVVEHGMPLADAKARVGEIANRIRQRGIETLVLKTGKWFAGPIADDPRYHVEAARGQSGPTAGKTNWHLTTEGYAIVVKHTLPQVLAALKKAQTAKSKRR